MKNIAQLCIIAASLYSTTYGMDQQMQQIQRQRDEQIRFSNEMVFNQYINSNQPVPPHILATVSGGHANLAAFHNQRLAQQQHNALQQQLGQTAKLLLARQQQKK
jgi:hypothetical protein